MAEPSITELEAQIGELVEQLNRLRAASPRAEVPDYEFDTTDGVATLSSLFDGRDQLLVIHNMGEHCPYCTLWADGLNGQLAHLETALAVALVSKDPPEQQREFARSRGWGFRLASHGGGDYIREQTTLAGEDNMPGAVVYERDGDTIYRKNSCTFGPGDLYCPTWHLLALAGISEDDWVPANAR